MYITKPVSLIFFFTIMVLQGCASVSTQAISQAPVSSVTPQNQNQNQNQGSAELPNVELSHDVMYQILTADFAVKRGQYDVALNTYLQLAETTRDPRLAKDATRIAIFSRDDARALDEEPGSSVGQR